MERKPGAEKIDADRESRIAEERALLAAQKAMQRLVNAQGLRYRDLARRLGVSEARVSQLFGDDASNLTMRTLAKVFHTFGEELVITSKSEFERALSDAKGSALDLDTTWHVPFPDFVLWDHSATKAEDTNVTREAGRSAGTLEWALAYDAQSRRSRITG